MGSAEHPDSSKTKPTELEKLKAQKWPSEGREERIARAREAWERGRDEIHLSPEMWKVIAEDPDLEE